jgi:hypothetical protein
MEPGGGGRSTMASSTGRRTSTMSSATGHGTRRARPSFALAPVEEEAYADADASFAAPRDQFRQLRAELAQAKETAQRIGGWVRGVLAGVAAERG